MIDATAKTYEDGLREGRLASIETVLADHKGRLDNHSQRIRLLERVMWIMFGAIALLEFAPKVQALMAILK